jgi:hypothetical protein
MRSLQSVYFMSMIASQGVKVSTKLSRIVDIIAQEFALNFPLVNETKINCLD